MDPCVHAHTHTPTDITNLVAQCQLECVCVCADESGRELLLFLPDVSQQRSIVEALRNAD